MKMKMKMNGHKYYKEDNLHCWYKNGLFHRDGDLPVVVGEEYSAWKKMEYHIEIMTNLL